MHQRMLLLQHRRVGMRRRPLTSCVMRSTLPSSRAEVRSIMVPHIRSRGSRMPPRSLIPGYQIAEGASLPLTPSRFWRQQHRPRVSGSCVHTSVV